MKEWTMFTLFQLRDGILNFCREGSVLRCRRHCRYWFSERPDYLANSLHLTFADQYSQSIGRECGYSGWLHLLLFHFISCVSSCSHPSGILSAQVIFDGAELCSGSKTTDAENWHRLRESNDLGFCVQGIFDLPILSRFLDWWLFW